MHRTRRAVAVLMVSLVAALGVSAGTALTSSADAYRSRTWVADYDTKSQCQWWGRYYVYVNPWAYWFPDYYTCDPFYIRPLRKWMWALWVYQD